MAWQAILVDRVVSVAESGRLEVQVVYTDGIQKVVRAIPLEGQTIEGFKAIVRAQLAQLSSGDVTQTLLKMFPPGEPIDTTPAEPEPPTPEALERQAWESATRRGLRAYQLVQAGLWSADDKTYTDLVAQALSLGKPEYL